MSRGEPDCRPLGSPAASSPTSRSRRSTGSDTVRVAGPCAANADLLPGRYPTLKSEAPRMTAVGRFFRLVPAPERRSGSPAAGALRAPTIHAE